MAEDEAYDYKFVKWMIKEKVSFFGVLPPFSFPVLLTMITVSLQKLAAIPVTAFVGEDSTKHFEKYIRLCFIKVR